MSGRFVVVSNRGHQSIAILRVISKGPRCGELRVVGYFHTRGETPRHFQFDSSGQYLVVANQDTDSIAVFNFNLSNGEMKYTGNEYRVPSPNFVCCCPVHENDLPASTVMEEMVVSSKSAMVDSDLESVGSTLPTDAEEVNKVSRESEELTQARLEIEELKRQLASLQAGN
jgi:hypothetical protein